MKMKMTSRVVELISTLTGRFLFLDSFNFEFLGGIVSCHRCTRRIIHLLLLCLGVFAFIKYFRGFEEDMVFIMDGSYMKKERFLIVALSR